MPLVMSDAEELAWLIGELIQDDVQCWEMRFCREPHQAVLLVTTKAGKDYRLTIRQESSE